MKNMYIVSIILIVMIVIFYGINIVLKGKTNVITNEDFDEINYQRITPEKFKEEIENLNSDEYIILDVRTKEEYDEIRIKDSVLLPLDNILKAEEIIKDKNKRIYVYCRSGARSMDASYQLIAMGYNNVYDLGGIIYYPYEKIKK